MAIVGFEHRVYCATMGAALVIWMARCMYSELCLEMWAVLDIALSRVFQLRIQCHRQNRRRTFFQPLSRFISCPCRSLAVFSTSFLCGAYCSNLFVNCVKTVNCAKTVKTAISAKRFLLTKQENMI